MSKSTRTIVATILLKLTLLALAWGQVRSAMQTGPFAIRNVSVIPMDEDSILSGQTVLVSGDRITAMGSFSSVEIPHNATIIEGRGRFLIPGLSDMHAHLRRKKGHMPQDYLRQGITVVRNMQGDPDHLKFRDQLKSGEPPGPLFSTAGQALAGRAFDRRHRVVKNEEEGRAAVREQVKAGYDYIKVYSFLSLNTYTAIMDEARKLGVPVIGHVPDAVRASGAIAEKQSSLEHFYGYFWELEAQPSEIRGEWKPRRLFHAVEIDDNKLSEWAGKTASAGVWNCPTLWRKNNYMTAPIVKEAWETPGLRALGESNRKKLVKALHDAGANLLAGTDDKAQIIHEELALFVEAGLTPFEALRIATVNAARYLGAQDDFGTVKVGKRANLVLLDANPLAEITNTRTIVGVMMNGSWIPVDK